MDLLWEVLVFQFKLAADGLRDLLLSPLSLIAALFGLLFGGSDPRRYFRRVLGFGHRSERWINLFGNRPRRGTSDDYVHDLREHVFTQARSSPWMTRAGSRLNQTLDQLDSRRLPKDHDPRS